MAGNNNMIEVTVVNEDGITLPLTVSSTSFVGELKPLIFNAIGLPIFEQMILYEGKTLFDLTVLSSLNIKSGDILYVVQNSSPSPIGLPSPPQSYRSQAEAIKQHILSDQSALQQLLHNDAVLAEAVLGDDMDLLTSIVKERIEEKNRIKLEEERRISQLNANYLDPEAQRQIEEEIRMGNVNENMHAAMEHNPESFGRVVMLYIDCYVNNTPVKAFVDSGAQVTLMSAKCAERCGIMRLLDRRYATTLVGVGTSQALGRVHVCTIKIGNSFYNSSFTIVDDDRVEFLLGLDMLRKHQCIIDLPSNCLRLGNGEDSVPFLAEKDIPKHALGMSTSLDELPLDDNNIGISNNINNNPGNSAPLSSNIIDPNVRNINQPPPSSSNHSPNEDAIQLIMGMGYSRNQALEALSMCQGNADAALSLLTFQ